MTTEIDTDYRLARNASPRRYELVITPELDAGTFSGEELVEIEVHEPTARIVLNAADLDVTSASVSPGRDDRTGDMAQVALDEERQRLVLTFASELEPGTWFLRARFAGSLNDKLAGFYRSTFTGPDGAKRVIAATQFEATDARRAFPCWDEPDRKAVFSVTLVVPAGMLAVSNSAVVEDLPAPGGRRRVRFADTILMSTYLVAFVVGPLEATEPVEAAGVPLRVVHVPGKAHLTGWALETAAHALSMFAEWFGIAYPADKLDLIALPDFAFGAMENLGAVTFREALLLADPASSSRLELERIADVVSHELAHMWFGDLVTMKWWNGLWLNEAFATFMEILCVDHLRPEWERWVSFGRSRAAAQVTDGLSSTRPIEYPVARPEEAQGMFDILTYEKGASVLRMLERYLGAETFRDGIRHYLSAHLRSNAETTDLWDAIEQTSGQPVRSIMDSWIFQGGHPMVSVGIEGNRIQLSQEPFRYLPAPAHGTSAIGSHWQIPVVLRVGTGAGAAEHKVLLGAEPVTFDIDDPNALVVANAGGWGFYRSRYSPELLARVTAEIASLAPLERFSLLGDTWAAVQAGTSRLADMLPMLSLVRDDDDPTVWSVVTAVLGAIDRMASDADRPAAQAHARAVLRPALDRLGWERRDNDKEQTGTLRSNLIAAAARLGADDEVRARAAAVHAAGWSDPDIGPGIIAAVADGGGPAEHEMFLERFRHASTPQEELRYLYGLAGFRDPLLVQRTLEIALTEARSQNGPILINAVLSTREGAASTWELIKQRWDALVERFPDNMITRMVEGVSGFTRRDMSEDVHEFFRSHPVPSGQRTLEQTLELMDVAVALAEREGPSLGATLSSVALPGSP